MIARFSSDDSRLCDEWLKSMGASIDHPEQSEAIGWMTFRDGRWHASCLTNREAQNERVARRIDSVLAAD